MDPALDPLASIALSAGLAWASGLRLYLVIFLAGLLAQAGQLHLPPTLAVLREPLVIGVAGILALVETIADKVPLFDSFWDTLQTFVRIPAGAALAASVFGDASGATALAAAILGGTLAAGSHLAKSGSRMAINASPEPFSNWAASFGEELTVGALLWLAFAYPLAALLVVAALTLLMIWLVPKLWRFVRGGFERVRRALGGASRNEPARSPGPAADV